MPNASSNAEMSPNHFLQDLQQLLSLKTIDPTPLAHDLEPLEAEDLPISIAWPKLFAVLMMVTVLMALALAAVSWGMGRIALSNRKLNDVSVTDKGSGGKTVLRASLIKHWGGAAKQGETQKTVLPAWLTKKDRAWCLVLS